MSIALNFKYHRQKDIRPLYCNKFIIGWHHCTECKIISLEYLHFVTLAYAVLYYPIVYTDVACYDYMHVLWCCPWRPWTIADHGGLDPFLTMEALAHFWAWRPRPIADHARVPGPFLTLEGLTHPWSWRPWPIQIPPVLTTEFLTHWWPWKPWPFSDHRSLD